MSLKHLLILLFGLLLGCPGIQPGGDDDDDATGDDDDATGDGSYSFSEEEGGPTATFCMDNPPADPPGGALCTVEGSGATVVFQGIVLDENEVLYGGRVSVSGSQIACVGCDCPTAGNTVVTCPWGVLTPGLINAHDHISFTQNHPEPHGDIRYQHRHDWRRGNNGHDSLSVSGGASNEERAWGELRFALSGGTSINGSGNASGLLRNLDANQEGLGEDSVEYETFPLGDTSGFTLESGCSYPNYNSESVLNNDAYTPHIAEGIDLAARNELLCLSTNEGGGTDLIESNTGIIHAVALKAVDAAMLAEQGASVIWSPRSNVDLYGNTAPVTMLDTMGVNLALGTDWTASGSMNVLRELACMDYLNAEHYGGALGDWRLWSTATTGAARALAVDDATGSLTQGLAADLAIFDGRGTGDRPFRAVIEANVEDAWLTVRGGDALSGEPALVGTLGGGCEELPFDVCGETRMVCLADTGFSYSELESSNSGSYDLFACGTPDNEPSCEPFRPGEYGGTTSTDQDGDGVDDGDDNCPSVFNPVRLVDDDNAQADGDNDGLGDACDPCPVGEDDDGECIGFDPDDRDGDGITNDLDNCPNDANSGQEDADADGIGDVCDLCPDTFNEPGENCAADVYDIKRGLLEDGLPVRVSGLLVTAVGENGFFAQVPEAERDVVLGEAFSGLFTYAPADAEAARPEVGDLVAFDGSVNEWFGQWQLDGFASLNVDSSGNDAPAPTLAEAADVATGGDLADDYEGLLVIVQDVEVLSYDPPAGPSDTDPTGSFVVEGGLRVNDYLTSLEPRPLIGDRVDVTGLMRFANDDSKLEPRSADDVQTTLVGEPELDSFGPASVFLYDGDVAASTIPPLMLTLDRPAGPGGTEVTLTAGHPGVLGAPASVTVPEGETEVEVLLDGLQVWPTTVTLEALLGSDVAEVEVTVLDPAAEPSIASITPATATMTLGQVLDLTVNLDLPAGSGGVTVDLALDPGTALTGPASVDISEGTLSATFAVEAILDGSEVVTATLGESSASASLEILSTPPRGLVVSEVLYDTPGDDNGKEWVELLNDSPSDIDLSTWSIGAGGTDYTYSTLQLVGVIPPGGCWVIGGPDSSPDNANPTFDQSEDFSPDLQNSGSTADGVALFDVTESNISSSTVPVSVVVYGTDNLSGLLGPDGAVAGVDVGDASGGSSIELTAAGWVVQEAPSPGDCSAAF